jgi:membrane protein DedA with SNARE-associated domain
MSPVQNFLIQHGYIAIFILAMMESMCIPVPSEIIFGLGGALTAAAFVASTHSHAHPLSVVAVIVAGVGGELLGALISYHVGRYAGRALVDRYGKYILLSHKDLDSAERWFGRFGVWSVLIGRVVPVVRSVISLPAGVAEMSRGPFALFTVVGSTIWATVLVLVGRAAGTKWDHLTHTMKAIQYPVIAIIVLGLAYGFWHRWRAVRGSHQS